MNKDDEELEEDFKESINDLKVLFHNKKLSYLNKDNILTMLEELTKSIKEQFNL